MTLLGRIIPDIATFANLATALAVLVAVIFGIVQIRQGNRKRRDMASIDVVHTFQTPEVGRAFHMVLTLPDAAAPELVRASPEMLAAANRVSYVCETWGFMVFDGVIHLRTLDHTMGGAIRRSWRKLRPYIEADRESNQFPNFSEWFQWVADRLEEYPAPRKEEGAYVVYRDWKP